MPQRRGKVILLGLAIYSCCTFTNAQRPDLSQPPELPTLSRLFRPDGFCFLNLRQFLPRRTHQSLISAASPGLRINQDPS
jgi:hypothetical protein